MKTNFSHIGIARLCGWFGITRQAYYQNVWGGISITIEEELIIQEVKQIRKRHHRIGTRKLYEMLQSFLIEHQIKIGRDALFDMLSVNHLLVRKRKRYIVTTNSRHWLRKYPNLVREFVPTAINQLWVSDITYWKLDDTHVYISFLTDVYSHKIIGYQVAETLEAIESIKALQMAVNDLGLNRPVDLIHHSDRGHQYCSQGYVKLLQDHNIKISMTENGDPLENAVAERVNGIIKGEYLEHLFPKCINDASIALKTVVDLYNNERPHMSVGNLTPNFIHQSKSNIKTEKLWKNYYKKQPMLVKPNQD